MIILASNFQCIFNPICQWYDTENLVPTPRRAEDEINLQPEQLALITQKQRNMPQARGDSMLPLTENRETLIRTASEQASFSRWVEMDNSVLPMRFCYGWKQLYILMQRILRTKKFSELEITSSSYRSCQDRTSDWNWSDWSTSTITTTRSYEVLGATITRNWQRRTTISSYRD